MAEQTATVIEDTSRKGVIAAAVAAADATVEGTTEEKPTEKKVEPTETEEAKKSREAEETQLVEQGKQLILALKDPEKSPLVIKFLAEQAGYTKVVASKAEAAEAKDAILEALEESLGDEFKFLASKLAPGIKKALALEVEKSQADIKQTLQEQETEKLRNQSAVALEKLTTGFFGDGSELPENVSQEMSKFMDRVPPGPDTTIKEYIEDAFNAAIGKLGLAKVDKSKQERTSKNRVDAVSRLSGSSGRAPAEDGIKQGSKPMTRQEAIRAAIEAADKEN